MEECWICRRNIDDLEKVEKGLGEGRTFNVSMDTSLDHAWICCVCQELIFQTISRYFGDDIATHEELKSKFKELNDKIEQLFRALD